MNTHEEYVTYAQAKALKELGFDWPCHATYQPYPLDLKEMLLMDYHPTHSNGDNPTFWIAVPTQAVACRWLREENDIEVYAVRHEVYGTQVGFLYKVNYHSDNLAMSKGLPTYEAAISAGIDRALELLKGGEV